MLHVRFQTALTVVAHHTSHGRWFSMVLSRASLQFARGIGGVFRHSSRKVARVATRFNRAGLYIWDLMVWSRIEAARTGLISLDLPAKVLARKNVPAAPPTLRVRCPLPAGSMDHFNDGFAAVNVILFGNLQLPDTVCEYRYALPGPAFRGVYLWDSAFIAQIWRHWDGNVASDLLRAVVSLRDRDRLQHVVADFVQSTFTQPPLIAWSLVRLDGEPNHQIAELYPALVAYHRWLLRHRRLPSGLFAWAHPYESGIDNSPRFSTRDESRFTPTAEYAAPDFSTYMALHAENLGILAGRLGRVTEAMDFENEARDIRAAMNAQLWHEEDGCYYDRHAKNGAWVRIRTIASLLPLWAGVPDQQRANRMREQAIDPRRFGTLIPFPSVARDEPSFEPDMWRGPVWVNCAYGVLLGLQRYGFFHEMAELGWRLCDGVYRVFSDERQIYEFYHPQQLHSRGLARKRGNWWKQLTLGSGPQREFVGWSGLVNNIMIELLFGFDRREGRRVVRPAFPAAAAGMVFRLNLPAQNLTLEVAVETPNDLHCFVQGSEGLRTFNARFAEEIDLDAQFARPASSPPLPRA